MDLPPRVVSYLVSTLLTSHRSPERTRDTTMRLLLCVSLWRCEILGLLVDEHEHLGRRIVQ